MGIGFRFNLDLLELYYVWIFSTKAKYSNTWTPNTSRILLKGVHNFVLQSGQGDHVLDWNERPPDCPALYFLTKMFQLDLIRPKRSDATNMVQTKPHGRTWPTLSEAVNFVQRIHPTHRVHWQGPLANTGPTQTVLPCLTNMLEGNQKSATQPPITEETTKNWVFMPSLKDQDYMLSLLNRQWLVQSIMMYVLPLARHCRSTNQKPPHRKEELEKGKELKR